MTFLAAFLALPGGRAREPEAALRDDFLAAFLVFLAAGLVAFLGAPARLPTDLAAFFWRADWGLSWPSG